LRDGPSSSFFANLSPSRITFLLKVAFHGRVSLFRVLGGGEIGLNAPPVTGGKGFITGFKNCMGFRRAK
jgi:hypothetical protein